MDDVKTIKFSKTDGEDLQHLSDLLHLFHHRNKNQHRRSLWWRHFSIFRRQLNFLVEQTDTLNQVPKTHLERSRKKLKDEETRSTIAERLNFWQDLLVPKWQNAFSQIVADGRFAVLGLVLIAALAQVCHITKITTAYDGMGQVEVEKVLEDFGREHWEAVREQQQNESGESVGEDLGVVVARGDEATADTVTATPMSTAKPPKRTSKLALLSQDDKRPPRKKRKTTNAIDNLFSDLD